MLEGNKKSPLPLSYSSPPHPHFVVKNALGCFNEIKQLAKLGFHDNIGYFYTKNHTNDRYTY
jgi:hypothetical protein